MGKDAFIYLQITQILTDCFFFICRNLRIKEPVGRVRLGRRRWLAYGGWRKLTHSTRVLVFLTPSRKDTKNSSLNLHTMNLDLTGYTQAHKAPAPVSAGEGFVLSGDFNRQIDQPRDDFWTAIDDGTVCT